MNSDLNNYINEYIILCSQLCKHAGDYTKENVARHNNAMKKLCTLKEQLYVDPQLTESVYSALLKSEDTHVQQSAATDCLSLNILINDSVKILRKISRCGNKMSALTAKRALLIHEGKLSPNDPF